MIDSIGARLKQARELRRLSIQEVSETTRVRPHYLQALESNDYSAIPSAAQARGFLRLYARFLELDLAELIPPTAPAAGSDSMAEAVPLVPADTPAQDAAASKQARASLWTNLRQMLARRTNKDAAASPAPERAISPEFPAPLPASTEATTKASRRTKPAEVAPVSDDSGPDALDVKKNVRS